MTELSIFNWQHIAEVTTSPEVYLTLIQLNRTISQAALILKDKKRKEFLRKIENINKLGKKEIYFVLPNGKKEGLYQKWHRDGYLLSQVNYVDDKKEGPYQEWRRDGSVMLCSNKHDQLKSQRNYVNDKLEGLYQEWFTNGSVMLRSNITRST